jgi:tetratricopeptide (TPR) repeat protein
LFLAFPMCLPAQQKAPASAAPPASSPPDAQAKAGTYDPLTAEQDIDVGNFYMRKGDIDAAISRYKDAIQARANFAKPRLLLGEAYEKKNDKATAVKYYKEYLQVLPHAPDAQKIEKKIEKLSAS